MKALLFHIVIAGAACASFGSSARAHVDPSREMDLAFGNVVRANVSRLAGGDREASEALDRLRILPRQRLLKILREDFRAYPVPDISVLRAITQLELRELEPDLRQLAKKTDSWTVIRALNSFAPSREINEIYLKRLALWQPIPLKIAMLDGLNGTVVPESLFNRLTEDPSPEVRIAAWSHFLTVRHLVSVEEQARRLRLAFAMKPYTVRVSAYTHYQRFPASVRSRARLPLCEDAQEEVRMACELARRGQR